MAIKPFNYQQTFPALTSASSLNCIRLDGEGRGATGWTYKAEILPFWRYKDEASAMKSAEQIYQLFEAYRQQDDFVEYGHGA